MSNEAVEFQIHPSGKTDGPPGSGRTMRGAWWVVGSARFSAETTVQKSGATENCRARYGPYETHNGSSVGL